MPPEESFTASTAEVQQLIQRLVSLRDKWPSEPTLAHLSPRMVSGVLAYTNRARNAAVPSYASYWEYYAD